MSGHDRPDYIEVVIPVLSLTLLYCKNDIEEISTNIHGGTPQNPSIVS